MTEIPDNLLLPLLQAPDAREAERRLRQLLDQHIAPLVAGIVRQRMGVSPLRRHKLWQTQRDEDAEDVFLEAMAGVGARLRMGAESLKRITDLNGYVAVATYRAFYTYLRRKYPVRSRLKQEIQRTLKSARDLALWRVIDVWAGGRAQWAKLGMQPLRSPRLDLLCSAPDRFVPADMGTHNPRLLPVEDLLIALFRWLEHPVELDPLVSVVALQYGLRDQEPTTLDGHKAAPDSDEERSVEVPDTTMDPPTLAARRALFVRMWEQISALPPNQCAALLLNWKDDGGRLTTIFVDSGIITQREVAAAMQVPLPVLRSVWDDMPLDDNTIAELLGVTRQKVINLRAAALKRLSTREHRVLEG